MALVLNDLEIYSQDMSAVFQIAWKRRAFFVAPGTPAGAFPQNLLFPNAFGGLLL